MRRGRYIEMILVTIAVVVMTAVSTRVCAQEIAIEDTLINEEDVLVADTMVNNDPEWYVAPVDRAIIRAPKRAAAGTCPIDSIQTYDENGNLAHVSIYEYGDTTRTITWFVNLDGSRVGESKEESGTNGNIDFTASYEWDYTTNNWKGTSKTEDEYTAAGKKVRHTTYVWINGAWMADAQLTWTYDAAGREWEYTTYIRNAGNNQLVITAQRIREWYNASKTTLDIQYTAYTNGNPSAGKKTESTYDASGNQLTKVYYASYNGGTWVASTGSTSEIWEYTSGKNTYYEKHTGSNTGWVKNIKKIWEFNNAAGKQTFYEEYGVNNGEWAIVKREIAGYNEYNNQTLVENYTFNKSTGLKTGSKKEEYTLKDNTTQQLVKLQYKWVAASTSWENNIKTVKAYDGSKTIDNCVYNWKNDEWVGVYTRTKTTYSGNNPIDVIEMSWSADSKDWVNTNRTETEYTGTNKTKETTSAWQNDAWQTTGRTDYHWTSGKNDTITKYTSDGVVWTPVERTINRFNAAGTNIMTHKATWTNNRWTLKSMTRKDIVDHVVNGQRQTLTAEWNCGSDSVWIGVKKDTALYLNSTMEKQLYTASYKGWQNNDWKPVSMSKVYYDEQERSIDEQSFLWNNGWKGNIRNEYRYDERGRRSMIATYVGWDNSTNYWKGSNKTEYTFNTNGSTNFYIIYKWGGSDWVYEYRNSFSYDGSENEIEHIVEQYANNGWVNQTKNEKEYKGGTLVKNNEYTWLNNTWTYKSRNEQTYDEDAQAKLRREILGTWNSGGLISFEDNHYFYPCDPRYHTIRFLDEDGTLLEAKQVAEGEVPSCDETPTKIADTQHEYTFTNWSPEVVAATGDATYTAIYTATHRKYMITWLNEDGSQLSQAPVAYGEIPAYNGETPTKESSAEFSYVFSGWTTEPVAVIGEATYTAAFTATKRSYAITWLNEDGTQLSQTTVLYGEIPAYSGETPTKKSSAEFSYVFSGWTTEPIAVTGEASYTASFTATKRSYAITWLNEDGTQLSQATVLYGEIPAYNGETPTKESSAEFSYAFSGWTTEPVAVTGEATYTAAFTATKRSYAITWLMDDGSVIDQAEVEYGSTPAHANINKESTAKYTYTFKGWSPEVSTVTGEASYIAQFDSVINKYTVTFYFEDGVTVIKSTEVAYGEMPSIDITPSRVAEEHYYYVFAGWSPEITEVTGDVNYTANFNKKPKEYEILFKDWNGAQLLKANVAYGTVPQYTGTPERRGNAHYSYTFTGWSPELAEVTGNATYTAVYKTVVNMYTVQFLDEDGTELENQLVAYGVVPAYQGEAPTKEDDEEYIYTFAGWSPRVTAVTSDAAYYATYTAHKKTEGFESITDHQSPITNKVMIDGRIYIIRGGHTYTTDGIMVE